MAWLGLALLVDDDVVDGDLCTRTSRSGKGDDGHTLVLGGSTALKRHNIREFRVVGHNADTLGGIHRTAASDGYDAVGTGCLEGLDTLLHIGDGGVGLDFGIDVVGESCGIDDVGDHLGGTHLDEALVGADESLVEIHTGNDFRQLLAGAGTKVTDFVENETLGHVLVNGYGLLSLRSASLLAQRKCLMLIFEDKYTKNIGR